MRKILCFVMLVLLVSAIYGQAPGLFNYQGVARNSVGNVLQNKNISLRLSVHDVTENGPVVYAETRTVITNPFGLFNIQVGSPGASNVTGTITTVNWASGKKYIQVEIDPAGGSAFINIGTSQLASVPYALNATGAAPIGAAGGDLGGTYPNPAVTKLQTRNISNTAPANGQALVWDAVASTWKPGAPSINNIAWGLAGNSGTNPVTHFIGTTDDQPILFRLNNNYAGKWDAAVSNYFIGVGAGQNTTPAGANNIGIGFDALFSNTTGQYNMAVGTNALLNNTTGNSNIAIGRNALIGNTSGKENIAIGDGTLFSNATGVRNTAVGTRALNSNTSGSTNTANGYQSLYSNTIGSANTANGYHALYSNTDGSLNTAYGHRALEGNTTASYNTAIGLDALVSNTTGEFNTAVGLSASFYNISGNYNTALGANTALTTDNLSNTTAVGFSAQVDASNKVRIGNTGVTSIGGQVGWTTFSDGRYKTNVQEDVKGLAFINALRPVTYTVDIVSLNKSLKIPDSLYKTTNDNKMPVRQTGFIAQEVETAAKTLGFSFSGVDVPQQRGNHYGIRYAEFVVPLVKAVQEQQVEIMKQREEINQLRQLLQSLIEEKRTIK